MSRPKTAAMRIVDDSFNSTRHAGLKDHVEPTGKPIKPKMKKAPGLIWDRCVERWPWLTEADSDTLHRYCVLQAKFEADPLSIGSTMMGHLRSLSGELGGDPVSRARLAIHGKPTNAKEEDKFFKD